MQGMGIDEILGRIERETGVEDLAALLAERLEPADLHSLLLEVYRRRADRRTPQQRLQQGQRPEDQRPHHLDDATLLPSLPHGRLA